MNVTCKSSNLIYCITCKVCNKQFVGQMGDPLSKQVEGHRGDIRRKELTQDIGRHFNQGGHHDERDITITILDFIYAPPKSKFTLELSLQIKFNWIQHLRTMLPLGLNTKDRTRIVTYCRSWKNYRDTGKIQK